MEIGCESKPNGEVPTVNFKKELSLAMNTIRLLRLVASVIVWGTALFAVLQIGIAHEHAEHTHSICGPWGCGPPVAALVSWQGFWLVLVAPIVGLLIRSWPANWLRTGGLVLFAAGIATLVGIVIWEVVTWLPLVEGHPQTYFVQRFFFSVITLSDIPIIPVTLAGIAMYLSARIKRVTISRGTSRNEGTSSDHGQLKSKNENRLPVASSQVNTDISEARS